MKTHTAQAVYYTAPNQVELRSVDLPEIAKHQVLIQTHYSAISSGTESMIYQGHFPENARQDVNIQSLKGHFKYPFRYGYALVGEVVEVGPEVVKDWLGKRVFVFHPHQSYALASLQDCWLIPDDMPADAAVFLPNVEAALNFVMDAAPVVGENAMVVGQGVLGLLTTRILAKLPLTSLVGVDPLVYRREAALDSGVTQVLDPTDKMSWQRFLDQAFTAPAQGLDLVIELSGTAQGLNQAIEMSGFCARILVGSWYDSKQQVSLGEHFHRQRIRLISSQVSTISSELSARWDKARRLNLAWSLIRQIKPETLISHRFAVEQCQQAFELVKRRYDGVLQVILEYN